MTSTRENKRLYYRELGILIRMVDRDKLRDAGDTLQGNGPFVLYRGVCGRGRARRIRGYSWTSDLDRAKWFAVWNDQEDPAVFVATVEAEDVLFCADDREEKEFVLDLKPDHPVKRAPWSNPETTTLAKTASGGLSQSSCGAC